MKGEEIVDRVLGTLDDDSFTADEVLGIINEGMEEIAGEMLLPALETTGEIITVVDEYKAELPEDYHHGLFACDSPEDILVDVCSGKKQILAKYDRLNYVGAIQHVAAVGGNIIYQPIPVLATTHNISYYALPPQIKGSTVPTWLKPQFHKALYYYATFTLFEDIEDEDEGERKNVKRFEGKYDRILERMKLFYKKEGQSKREAPVVIGSYL